MDVLDPMLVTAAVSHLERSALNLEADWNAVGGCRCRGGQNPKINKNRENVNKKATGVSGQNSSERSKGQQKKKMWGGRTVAHVRHRRRVPF